MLMSKVQKRNKSNIQHLYILIKKEHQHFFLRIFWDFQDDVFVTSLASTKYFEQFNPFPKQKLFRQIAAKFPPVGIYMFKVNNRNTRTRCEICSKLTIKTPELY